MNIMNIDTMGIFKSYHELKVKKILVGKMFGYIGAFISTYKISFHLTKQTFMLLYVLSNLKVKMLQNKLKHSVNL